KAISYATGHRFTVNEALGVLEVRDEAALEQLQPSLRAAAANAGDRLFDDVSDADLQRLGVDPVILPIVRLLTSAAHLEALQTMLPEAQSPALYPLGWGRRGEGGWARVPQPLTADEPPAEIDTDDLVSAMERTPGRVAFISGQDELQRILANPF